MKLKNYLKRNDISVPDFAAKVGCTRQWLYAHINDNKPLGKKLALRIEHETGEKVSIFDTMLIE